MYNQKMSNVFHVIGDNATANHFTYAEILYWKQKHEFLYIKRILGGLEATNYNQNISI